MPHLADVLVVAAAFVAWAAFTYVLWRLFPISDEAMKEMSRRPGGG